MPRERNSVKIDLAMSINDDVKNFIVRMLRHKLSDMDFEKEYYETELSIASDQKQVNLSNGRKYADLYKDKLERLSKEVGTFIEAINIVNKIEFPKVK